MREEEWGSPTHFHYLTPFQVSFVNTGLWAPPTRGVGPSLAEFPGRRGAAVWFVSLSTLLEESKEKSTLHTKARMEGPNNHKSK